MGLVLNHAGPETLGRSGIEREEHGSWCYCAVGGRTDPVGATQRAKQTYALSTPTSQEDAKETELDSGDEAYLVWG